MEECGLELRFNIKLQNSFEYDVIEKCIEQALKSIPESIGEVTKIEITDIWRF